MSQKLPKRVLNAFSSTLGVWRRNDAKNPNGLFTLLNFDDQLNDIFFIIKKLTLSKCLVNSYRKKRLNYLPNIYYVLMTAIPGILQGSRQSWTLCISLALTIFCIVWKFRKSHEQVVETFANHHFAVWKYFRNLTLGDEQTKWHYLWGNSCDYTNIFHLKFNRKNMCISRKVTFYIYKKSDTRNT